MVWYTEGRSLTLNILAQIFIGFYSIQWLSNLPDIFIEIHINPGRYTEVSVLFVLGFALFLNLAWTGAIEAILSLQPYSISHIR